MCSPFNGISIARSETSTGEDRLTAKYITRINRVQASAVDCCHRSTPAHDVSVQVQAVVWRRERAGSFKTVNDLRVGADVNGVGGGSRRTWYPGGTVAIAVRLPRTVAPFWRLGLRGRRGAVEGPRGLSMSWGSLRDSGPDWCAASSDVPRSHNCPVATLRSPLVRFGHLPATTPSGPSRTGKPDLR
jgi:hypothetical protein